MDINANVFLVPLILVAVVNCDPVFNFKLPKYYYDDQVTADPDVFMDATQLITGKGYPCENHWVTTEDGYILNVLRIPHGLKNKHSGLKPVVLLQHGLFGSAADFVANLANQSLSFILADAGADVWLANSRGNIYSQNHTSLDPKHLKFWLFSWDQMAKYDLPATINYVRKVSGQDKIFYTGHSQGTTIGFAEFSENQELASHITHFFALAPIAIIWHQKSPLIASMVPFAYELNVFLDLFTHGAINLPPKLMDAVATGVCSKAEKLCEEMLSLIFGPESNSMNKTRLPVYIAHANAGTSARDLLQWLQQISAKKFQKFDYGNASANMEHYGQHTPPQYEPSKMKVPVSLYSGGQDYLADPEDIAWLRPQINVTKNVTIDNYNHLDLVLAMNAADLIYKDIVKTVMS